MYSMGFWPKRETFQVPTTRKILRKKSSLPIVQKAEVIQVSRAMLDKMKGIFELYANIGTISLQGYLNALLRHKSFIEAVSPMGTIEDLLLELSFLFQHSSYHVAWPDILEHLKTSSSLKLPEVYQPENMLSYDNYRDALVRKGIVDGPQTTTAAVRESTSNLSTADWPALGTAGSLAQQRQAGYGQSSHYQRTIADRMRSQNKDLSVRYEDWQRSSLSSSGAASSLIFERASQRQKQKEIENQQSTTSCAMDVDDDDDDEEAVFTRQRLAERLDSRGNEQEIAVIQKLLQGPTGTDVIITKFNVEFLRKDMVCLKPGTWLNDEVINFYMSMLQERDAALCEKYQQRVPSHYFSSFFIERLLKTDGRYNFKNVARWSRKVDVFNMKSLVFPINIANTHWTLAVVSVPTRTISYYDSMSSSGSQYLEGLLHWLQDEAVDQTKDSVKAKVRQGKPQEVVDPAAWTLVSEPRSKVPQQGNGFDCGVFSIVCADYLSDGLPLKYSQKDMPYFRQKIACDIKRGSLNYSI